MAEVVLEKVGNRRFILLKVKAVRKDQLVATEEISAVVMPLLAP